MLEGVHPQEVKDIAVVLEAELEQSYRLAFDEALAIKSEHRGRIAS